MSTVRARDGVPIVARWSSGLRLRPLTPATAVRIRYGSPKRKKYGKHRIPNRVGVDSEEGPPVPIPNTVVKLFSAENTWRAAAREDKATPTFYLLLRKKRTKDNIQRTTEYIYCMDMLDTLILSTKWFEFLISSNKTEYASIAQLAEHAAVNRGVTGSSPV